MLLFLACTPAEVEVVDSAPTATDDTSVTTDTDPAPNDTDPGSGTDTPLSLALHDEIESIVYASFGLAGDASVRVEYRFDDDTWLSTPSHDLGAGDHELPVFGVPYATATEVRLVVGDTAGEAQSITTGELPQWFPQPTLLANVPEGQQETGNYLLGSINGNAGGWTSGEYWMFILDREARPVWVMRGSDDDYTIYLHVSNDGEILWDIATYWSDWDGGAGSELHRMDLEGTISQSWSLPGLHHCFVELPDGSIVWGAAEGSTTEIVKRAYPDGTVETVWDCRPFYAQIGETDWCHTNSIFHVPSRDTLLLSFPTRNTFVLEVDMKTGEELRWWGHVEDAWAFDPPESAFEYQHGATFTDSGTLMVSSQVSPASNEGVVREYALNETDQVLEQVWTFGAGDGITARNAGEAHRLPNGNTLHNTGTTPRVREITPQDEVVWDVTFQDDRLIGRTVLIEDLYDLAEVGVEPK